MRAVLTAIIPPMSEGFVEFRALPSKARIFSSPRTYAEVRGFLAAHAQDDLYFGVAARRTAANGAKENCASIGALFVDLDFKDIPEADARAALANCPLAHSIVIASGGGLHVYWLLKKIAVLPAQSDEVTTTLRGLAVSLGADMKCAEAARIMRLPGTKNHKYDPARVVTVESFDPDRRYELCDFDWVPVQTAPRALSEPITVSGIIMDGRRNDSLFRLARSLKAKGIAAMTIASTLHKVNEEQCKPPLDAQEINRIAESAQRPDQPGFDSTGQTNAEARIAAEVEKERARREAKRRVDAEERGAVTLPPVLTLRDWLAQPDEPFKWRIEEWQPAESRVALAAQFKAGKTTLRDNLVRSLADGDLWLGQYRVIPVTGTVCVLDTEMSRQQLKAWLRTQRIVRADKVVSHSLKGALASLNILDPTVRTVWAAWLRAQQVNYLILDCLRPVLDALSLDEHHEAGRFLVAFDALLAEAAIPEALVILHMGHANERARGDSRLRDWPDVEWRIVRQDEQASSPRFITAYGRDVDVPECQLAYDAASRRLSIGGGSRNDEKVQAALEAVIDVLRESGECTGRTIKSRLADSDHSRNTIEVSLKVGVHTGRLTARKGPKKSLLYSCVPVSRECPDSSRDTEPCVSLCPAPFVRAGHWDTGESLPDWDSDKPLPFNPDEREEGC